jgi:ABC-type nitrate/sulfonate/bicarbonate transport system substrate-binding protein
MSLENISRKKLLARAGAGLGVLAVVGTVSAAPAVAVNLIGLARPKVHLGWFGTSCEAPLYAAYEAGIFDRHLVTGQRGVYVC